VPIDGVAGSLEVALPLAAGEFTVKANTVSADGAVTDYVSANSPIVTKVFYSTRLNRTPILFGEVFARPVSFMPNSSSLSTSAKRALVLMSARLMQTRSSVAITGFTAQSGASRSLEKRLATERALSVARFLKSQGLSNILYVSGYGAIRASSNSDSARKVELRIIK
jgi:outer membrane protein OmpA-like peptidoglycan-associated protein